MNVVNPISKPLGSQANVDVDDGEAQAKDNVDDEEALLLEEPFIFTPKYSTEVKQEIVLQCFGCLQFLVSSLVLNSPYQNN